MNDTTLVTICGLASLGIVVVMLVALVMLRVMRFGVFGFANLIMRMLTEPKDEADVADIQAQAVPHISPTEVRALTETLDFDAAVERARQEKLAQQSDALIEPQPFIPDPPDLTPPVPNVNSPVTGRVFRDGRFRRMAAGIHGRLRNLNFRRVGRGGPINGA
ncbi:MAG: hypothetical protein HZC41_23740 [Chloroflexi bacterium]|nr:hypothetical protein [Chloroflexota bacterium]